MTALRTVLLRILPIVVATVFFALTLQALRYDGVGAIQEMVRGSVGSPTAIFQSFRWAVPLVIIGLGALVSFRSGYFNVGGIGQFSLGTAASAAVATGIPDGPPLVVVPLAIFAAIVAGAAWSLIPGILRIYGHADEVVTTLMANFVAQFLLLFLLSGPMRDRSSATALAAASAPVPDAFRVSTSSGISVVIVVIVVVYIVAVWYLVNRTAFGILSGIAGRNPLMLSWQGVKVERIGLIAFGFAGGAAGLAGALEILGPSGRLVTGLSPQVGNNAMLVALVAGLVVSGAVVSAYFFGALTAASLFLPVMTQLPASAIVVLNGLIAIFVTARFRIPQRRLRVEPDRQQTNQVEA